MIALSHHLIILLACADTISPPRTGHLAYLVNTSHRVIFYRSMLGKATRWCDLDSRIPPINIPLRFCYPDIPSVEGPQYCLSENGPSYCSQICSTMETDFGDDGVSLLQYAGGLRAPWKRIIMEDACHIVDANGGGACQ